MHNVERQLPVVDPLHIHAKGLFGLSVKLSRKHSGFAKNHCPSFAKLHGESLSIALGRLGITVGNHYPGIAAGLLDFDERRSIDSRVS